MGSTLVEKILSRHGSGGKVYAGEIVSLRTDRLLINDYVGELIFSRLEELGIDHVTDPDKVILNTDHNLPSFTVKAADKYVLFREKCRQYGLLEIPFCMGGIGHQLMCESYVHPHEIAVATDSHATMYGGLGAFSCGITAADALQILLTGECWFTVPETIRINVNGRLPKGVTAKDLALVLLNVFPPEEYIYRAVEIIGEAIRDLSIDSRLVIANLIAESGAKCAVFEADEKTYSWLGMDRGEYLSSDEDAVFAKTAELDVGTLEPQLSFPGSTADVHPLSEAEGERIDQVFIGSCTNGRLEDLAQAAEILKGRHVSDGIRLIVVPASQSTARLALKSGIMETLMDAGAVILSSSCASCAGNGPGLIGCGEHCLSTTNRNFKGRMGSRDAKIWLGSAYAAAAAAVTGRITDPRIFLEEK